MPDLNGLEVASLIIKTGLKTRVVFLTSHDDPTLVLQGRIAGASAYVLKENSYEELLKAVLKVYAGETFMSPQIETEVDKLEEVRGKNLLSRRELQVLKQIASGLTNKEAARALNITPRTVDTHKTRLKRKLNLRTLPELTQYAVKIGLLL